MKTKKINLIGSMANCKPRILWQQLFNAYVENGGPVDTMDNLLVDHECCKDLFRKFDLNFGLVSQSFLWGYDESFMTRWNDSEYTKDKGYRETDMVVHGFDKYLYVVVTEDEIIVEYLDCPDE